MRTTEKPFTLKAPLKGDIVKQFVSTTRGRVKCPMEAEYYPVIAV